MIFRVRAAPSLAVSPRRPNLSFRLERVIAAKNTAEEGSDRVNLNKVRKPFEVGEIVSEQAGNLVREARRDNVRIMYLFAACQPSADQSEQCACHVVCFVCDAINSTESVDLWSCDRSDQRGTQNTWPGQLNKVLTQYLAADPDGHPGLCEGMQCCDRPIVQRRHAESLQHTSTLVSMKTPSASVIGVHLCAREGHVVGPLSVC